jgi:hypothetical protein
VTSSEAGTTAGTVRIVTPEVNASTRLGLARISLSPGAQLRPGMFARADIDVGDQPATTVPTGAVLYRDVDDFYGPLSQYFNAGLFALFGPGLMVLVALSLLGFGRQVWRSRQGASA